MIKFLEKTTSCYNSINAREVSKLYRKDNCSNDGGNLLYIRIDISVHVLSNRNKTESIFAKINFRRKKWLIYASYNPHISNIPNHLHHLGKCLYNYLLNCDTYSSFRRLSFRILRTLLEWFLLYLEFGKPCKRANML